MPVTLESRVRRMQVFHLPHEVFCRQRCTCEAVTVVVVAENPRTGERAPKRISKKVPGSITILARERKPGLPSVVLEVADVKAAIGRAYLRVIEQTPDAPSAPTTSVPVPPASSAAPSSPPGATPAPAPGTAAPSTPAAVPPAKPPAAGA